MDRPSLWLLEKRTINPSLIFLNQLPVHAFIIFSLAECACQPTLALNTILSFRKDGPCAPRQWREERQAEEKDYLRAVEFLEIPKFY